MDKILSNSRIKNALSIYGGYAYRFPYIPVLATLLSVSYLNIHARRNARHEEERFQAIEKLLVDREAGNAPESVWNYIERPKIAHRRTT